MSDDARLRAGRVPLGMLVGVPAMFVLGAAGGLLACVFGWFAGFGTGSEAAFAIVGALLAWGIAIPLWLRTRRYGRPCAVGLAVSWAAITLSFLAVAGDDGMSDEEIAQEIAVLQASGAPAYYLGDEADGHDLATVDSSGVGDLAATGNGFGYGFHCEDGGCLSDVTVATLTVGPGWLGAGECERLEPVLGVPAVGRDYQLVLFTGESVIMLDDSDYGDDRKGERELAEELQRVGQSGSVKELPPPSPALLALLEEACEG